MPALSGLVALRGGVEGLPFLMVMVLAGSIEGASLGAGQAYALRGRLPGIERRWLLLTALGAAVAWALGMTPSSLVDAGAPTWLLLCLAPFLATALLASIGVAQWLVLRQMVRRSGRWIWWNAAAWIVGLPATFIFPMVVPNDAPMWVWVVAWLTAGATMAVTIAFATGYAMNRLLDDGS